MTPDSAIPVVVLLRHWHGGQRALSLLRGHPWFQVVGLGASAAPRVSGFETHVHGMWTVVTTDLET